jgi:Ca-activated chloride channel homolog
MTRRHEREIERRLRRMPADLPAAEPPAGLLERLRAEIPGDLGERLRAAGEAEGGTGAAGGPLAPVAPFPSRRWLAAAAMLVMLVGGGFLAWKLMYAVDPLGRVRMDGPSAGIAGHGGGDEPQQIGEGKATEEVGEAAARRLGRRAEQQEQSFDATEDLDETAEGAASDIAMQEAPGEASEPGLPRRPVSRPSPPPASPAPATDSATLTVRFVDEHDQELPGATIALEGASGSRIATTGADGTAVFPGLAPGHYRLTSSLEGFGTVRGEVDVEAGRAIAVELRTLLATIEEEIVVTGKMPIINTTSTTAASVYSDSNPARSRTGRRAGTAPPPPPPPSALQRKAEELTARPIAGAPPEIGHERRQESAERRRPESEPEGPLSVPEVVAGLAEEVVVAPPQPPPVNPEVATAVDRLSTFGLDVDTGSWTLLRDWLDAGYPPPPEAVRVEEVVNAQPFGDPSAAAPLGPEEAFRLVADGAPSPFAPDGLYRLLRFRIVARDLTLAERKPVVLTLVVDVSGSMAGDKLELVKRGLRTLLDALRPDDRVALVVFSDVARLAAPHGEPAALQRAAGELATEGGTNAEAGLRLGYRVARQAFDPAAANRVMLLSDGVANVGATGPQAILQRVAEEAADGIELTTVGVGMGDFDDEMLETLADRGDGRYAYVDDRREIDRLFSTELDGTLQTVAEEARAQVEFDPRVVESWRQLGYENRAIADHEFRYDSVDAGEIGPGHSVTALYEVKLRGTPEPGRPIALLKLRWRDPAAADGTPGRYHELEQRLTAADLAPAWSAAPPDLRQAAVAAELAEQLRRSPHADDEPATLLTEARRLATTHPPATELATLTQKWSDLSSPHP